jgi:hypothetical protein|eukprot:gnl/Ergobibamus_cyprinoides/235.p2 GENE.gnl/Ergobibamus_cyprinoides/235~~gnl/Ergobibamus_cyprinoides/235.p2  ORF type:complete len:159 (-),score=54.39 gnl/Ergobibamus_cyprinoides/235:731-1207(-)
MDDATIEELINIQAAFEQGHLLAFGPRAATEATLRRLSHLQDAQASFALDQLALDMTFPSVGAPTTNSISLEAAPAMKRSASSGSIDAEAAAEPPSRVAGKQTSVPDSVLDAAAAGLSQLDAQLTTLMDRLALLGGLVATTADSSSGAKAAGAQQDRK